MPDIHPGSAIVERTHGREKDARLFRHVMACLDRSPDAARILDEAVLLANQTGADLTAMRVVPAGSSTVQCADPVDWELTKRDETADILRMSDTVGATTDIRAIVACGSPARCIHDEALRSDVDLLVLGTGTFGPPSRWSLGGTARHLAEVFHGSVLLVPDDIAGEPPPYHSSNGRFVGFGSRASVRSCDRAGPGGGTRHSARFLACRRVRPWADATGRSGALARNQGGGGTHRRRSA